MRAVVELSFPAAYEVRVREERPGSDVPWREFRRAGQRSGLDLIVEVTALEERWFGLFQAGPPSVREAVTGVFATPQPTCMCVIVCGSAYLVDAVTAEDFEVVKTQGPVVGVRPVVDEQLLLLVSPWTVTAVGSDGIVWQTGRLAIERLRLDEVANGRVAGVADPDDDGARDFVIDLRTGEHEGGTPFL